MLDTSGQTMTTYDSKGLIARAGKQYDLFETARRVISYQRALVTAKASQNSGSGELKEQKTEEEIRGLRLENAIKEGELIDLDSVNHIIRKALIGTADFLESLPDAFENSGIINPGMTAEFIKTMDNQREALLSIVLTSVDEDTPPL